MKIDEMEGRELDALVAERVMGLSFGPYSAGPQPYSNSDQLAFQVVDKMIAEGWGFQMGAVRLAEGGTRWIVRFPKLDLDFRAVADSRSLAICRAALKAVSYEPPQPEP